MNLAGRDSCCRRLPVAPGVAACHSRALMADAGILINASQFKTHRKPLRCLCSPHPRIYEIISSSRSHRGTRGRGTTVQVYVIKSPPPWHKQLSDCPARGAGDACLLQTSVEMHRPLETSAASSQRGPLHPLGGWLGTGKCHDAAHQAVSECHSEEELGAGCIPSLDSAPEPKHMARMQVKAPLLPPIPLLLTAPFRSGSTTNLFPASPLLSLPRSLPPRSPVLDKQGARSL